MKLYILISLYNYFIMHDIKDFFFSIKLIRQLGGGKKNFRGRRLPKILLKNTIFQNPEGQLPLIYSESTPAYIKIQIIHQLGWYLAISLTTNI
jgi:hypothetical protein